MPLNKDSLKTYAVNLAAVIILAVIAGAVYAFCTGIVGMPAEVAGALMVGILPFVYKMLPDGSAAVFDTIYNYVKDSLGGMFKKDNKAEAGLDGLFVLAILIVAVILFAAAIFYFKVDVYAVAIGAAAFVGALIGKYWPGKKDVEIIGAKIYEDNIGKYVVLDKGAFYKAYGKARQYVFNSLPDNMPALPIKTGGQWVSGSWLVVQQCVVNGVQVSAGSIVTVRDLWPELVLTNADKYTLIVTAKSPAQKCFELLGEAAKAEMLKAARNDDEKAALWANLVANDQPTDAKFAVDAFCALTGYVPSQ